jgi:selenocysteine-specific elongation factor
MYIIGTAGHVDHGKTLLIKALTGTDTDRLPEEKKRGLTIDLGFAHFPDENGTEIGVVDVPGHEKFIRNMTAGAWGIDLALLIIAADDGWMYQSENHLRVLHAMGIKKIIVVITKIDIADKFRVDEVGEYAVESVREETGKIPALINVSAMTGTNIEKLKNLILKELSTLIPSETSEPLLYIDRTFTIQGTGLVVTGSLRNGIIKKNDKLLLLPQKFKMRVRNIQAYDSELEEVLPASRTALNLTGTGTEFIKRGCCLTTENSGLTAETEIIIRISAKYHEIRNHSEIELAMGTAHRTGIIHYIGESDCGRVVFHDITAAKWGQPVVVILKGGSRITGRGHIIWKGKTSIEKRGIIADISNRKIFQIDESNRIKLELEIIGYFPKKSTTSKEYEHSLNAVECGNYLLSKSMFKDISNSIYSLSGTTGGIRPEELPGKISSPENIIKAVCLVLLTGNKINKRNGIFFNSVKNAPQISTLAKKLLEDIETSGKAGYDISKNSIKGVTSEIRQLSRAGIIVPLSESLFYSKDVYNSICSTILKGLNSGDTFDIALAKDRTDLSRKYIIPVLNRMEEEKLVVREGSHRKVV